MVLAAMLFSALLCACSGCTHSQERETEPLLCYVGGTMRPAMEVLARQYEARTGQKVLIDFAGSGELMLKIEQTRRGDVYVAHDPFLPALMRKGLGERGWALAMVTPVIVVQKGNPKGVRGLSDLARPGIRLVLSHPVYSTAGWIIPVMAERAGVKEALESNIVSCTRGGSGAANAVIIGTADAAICWDAVAHLRSDKLDKVKIEPWFMPVKGVDAITSATFGRTELASIRVTAATLKCSRQPEAAADFAAFIASGEAAGTWTEFGFTAAGTFESGARSVTARNIPGELLVHCAAGMRRPIRQLAEEFEQAHGVRVSMTYSGSNMLLGQIELSRRGDVYIAGDADYIRMASEKGLVKSSREICAFIPVIMVGKDNPQGINALADLTRKGIRIGQGDEKAAAVGRLTPKLLSSNRVDLQAWKENVVLSTPTVNELGLKIKLGTIDAAVVWQCIARKYPEDGSIVTIDPQKNICPSVAGAVLTTTENPGAADAFLSFLVSDRGKEVLAQNGYTVERSEQYALARGDE